MLVRPIYRLRDQSMVLKSGARQFMPKVLLAEDKESLCHALRMTLEHAGLTQALRAAEMVGIGYRTLLTKIKVYVL